MTGKVNKAIISHDTAQSGIRAYRQAKQKKRDKRPRENKICLVTELMKKKRIMQLGYDKNKKTKKCFGATSLGENECLG